MKLKKDLNYFSNENINIDSKIINDDFNYQTNFYHFKGFNFDSYDIPQGWKIHVSCTPYNYNKILNIVAKCCFKNRYSFKYIKNIFYLKQILSSDSVEGEFGKFITIYPINIFMFKKCINELYKLLIDFDGPYIVSDLRFKDSKVVYYRYGAISRKDGYIKDNKVSIVDQRNYFSLPSNINNPFVDEDEEDESYEFDKIKPLSIASSSSGGNTYVVLYDNKKCIMKEARKNVYDCESSAIKRLENEENILLNYSLCPKLISSFNFGESKFIVEDFIEGPTLELFSSNPENLTNRNIFIIIKKMICLIERFHNDNLILNDISSSNFIVKTKNEDSYDIFFIDFEDCKLDNHMGLEENAFTPGFYDYNTKNLNYFDRDFKKIGYVFMNILSRSNYLNIFDKSGKMAYILFCNDMVNSNVDKRIFDLVRILLNENIGYFNKIKYFKSLKTKSFNNDLIVFNKSNSENIKNYNKIVKKTYKNILNSIYENIDFTADYNDINFKNGSWIVKGYLNDLYKIDSFKGIESLIDNFNKWIIFKYGEFNAYYILMKKVHNILCNEAVIASAFSDIYILQLCHLYDDNKNYKIKNLLLLFYKRSKNDIKNKKYNKLGLDGGYLKIILNIIYIEKYVIGHVSDYAFNEIKNVRKYISNGLLKKTIDSNVTSPYLGDGLAGLLLVELKLFEFLNYFNNYEMIKWINSDISELTSIYDTKHSGLYYGLTGIQYVISISQINGFFNLIRKENIYSKMNRVILFGYETNGTMLFPSKDFKYNDLTLENGSLGIYLFINNYCDEE